jgi:hypothetical protein
MIKAILLALVALIVYLWLRLPPDGRVYFAKKVLRP